MTYLQCILIALGALFVAILWLQDRRDLKAEFDGRAGSLQAQLDMLEARLEFFRSQLNRLRLPDDVSLANIHQHDTETQR